MHHQEKLVNRPFTDQSLTGIWNLKVHREYPEVLQRYTFLVVTSRLKSMHNYHESLDLLCNGSGLVQDAVARLDIEGTGLDKICVPNTIVS